MRKLLSILFVLLISCSLMAQVRTGNILGTVTDSDGTALPGVTVTLISNYAAPLQTITSSEGRYRFISLPPAQDYQVRVEMEGFRSEIRENIIIVLGANVNIDLVMQMGAIEELVTVVAVTPVVDSRKTSITQNVTREIMQSLPSARDPWVILQQAPGVLIDRQNVGGSESGQQSTYMAKGGGADMWSMDGVNITDPASISSPTYFDFDAFEEINISLGGSDVTLQTGGININLVSRRGGNKASIGGRFYYTDQKFQSENLTDELIAEGIVGTNKIRYIKDFGFNAGGPLWQDKIWWWFSYGVQDINNANIYGTFEATMLNNYAAKLNLQLIPENRFEAFVHIGGKEKTARGASYGFPGGWHQTGAFYFGSPILKLQDEHMFGDDLFLSFRFGYIDSGFNLIPEDDMDQNIMMVRDVGNARYDNSYYAYNCIRPAYQYNFLGQYYNDSFLGVSHELKFGFEYSTRSQGSRWAPSGNAMTYYNYNTATVDIDGDGFPDVVPGMKRFEMWRATGLEINQKITAQVAFLQDSISIGRLNLNLGLRWDKQVPSKPAHAIESIQTGNTAITGNLTSAAATELSRILPNNDIPEIAPDYSWSYINPRVGMTYDVSGDGKTIAKLSFGMYRDYMGTGVTGWFSPLGTGGWMDFWWFDATSLGGNNDGIVDLEELRWTTPTSYTASPVFQNGTFIGDTVEGDGWMWGSYDFNNPVSTSPPRTTNADSSGAYLTTEIIATLEREVMPDFGVALDFTWRKFSQFNWTRSLNDPQVDSGGNITNITDKQNQSEYAQAGVIPSSIPGLDLGEGSGKPYYLQIGGIGYRAYSVREQRPDFNRTYLGLDLRFNKRLSNKWMLVGSASLIANKVHYGNAGYTNKTNIWALDNNIYAPEMGGASGKIDVPVSSNWMVKLSGLYQLPLDFDVSFTFNARQGNPIFHSLGITDYNAPNTRNQSITVYLDTPDTIRLPNFWNLDLRLQKLVSVGDIGRFYIMVDAFNVFNRAPMIRRYEQYHGRYYVHDGSFSPNATYNMANEVLNPRVIRLGVRFQF